MSNQRKTSEQDFATVEFISEARRPLLIARHRQELGDAESTLNDGQLGNDLSALVRERIEAMTRVEDEAPPTAGLNESATRPLPPADEPAAAAAYRFETDSALHPVVDPVAAATVADGPSSLVGIDLTALIQGIADERGTSPVPLRSALVDRLCIFKEEQDASTTDLRLLALGVYRLLAARLKTIQGGLPTIDDLRQLKTSELPAILAPRPWSFGDHHLHRPFTPAYTKAQMRRLKALVRAEEMDLGWADATRGLDLSREDEEKVAKLPTAERRAARDFLARDRIRSRFYRQVFLEYLSADDCDVDQECRGEPTILAWMAGMAETPHLFPFLQGQEEGQKKFRISRLAEKLVQLYEIYARVNQAYSRDRLREKMEGKSSRERMAYLIQVHYPMIPPGKELTLAAMLCPLRTFIAFVQEKVGSNDFVLPPDPKPRPASIPPA